LEALLLGNDDWEILFLVESSQYIELDSDGTSGVMRGCEGNLVIILIVNNQIWQ
jgi:hypothetical protein